jgi:hypothetical protein
MSINLTSLINHQPWNVTLIIVISFRKILKFNWSEFYLVWSSGVQNLMFYCTQHSHTLHYIQQNIATIILPITSTILSYNCHFCRIWLHWNLLTYSSALSDPLYPLSRPLFTLPLRVGGLEVRFKLLVLLGAAGLLPPGLLSSTSSTTFAYAARLF